MTARDFSRNTQLNELTENFSDKLAILVFPSNQFDHLQNSTSESTEVKPDNNVELNAVVFDTIDVNGENEHPLFRWLKKNLPAPSDDSEAILKMLADPDPNSWKPITRSDIAGNFETFLISPDGVPVKRYSYNLLPSDMKNDIKNLFEPIKL